MGSVRVNSETKLRCFDTGALLLVPTGQEAARMASLAISLANLSICALR
jgi:hypothetical protein